MKLANLPSGGHAELDPVQFNAARQIATRIYEVTVISKAIGISTLAIDRQISDASVEAVYRQGKELELTYTIIIAAGDRVATNGPITQLEIASILLGREVRPPNGLLLVQEKRKIILTNRALNDRTMGDIHDQVSVSVRQAREGNPRPGQAASTGIQHPRQARPRQDMRCHSRYHGRRRRDHERP